MGSRCSSHRPMRLRLCMQRPGQSNTHYNQKNPKWCNVLTYSNLRVHDRSQPWAYGDVFEIGPPHVGCWGQNTSHIQHEKVVTTSILYIYIYISYYIYIYIYIYMIHIVYILFRSWGRRAGAYILGICVKRIIRGIGISYVIYVYMYIYIYIYICFRYLDIINSL